ncbi:MAG: hypothetical protein ACKVJK_16115, partial [Methylophagaceae bacterium]
NSHIDELDATSAGAAVGKAAGAIGSGIKNFAKGFGQGVKGGAKAPGATKANPTLNPIKLSIAKLNSKQQAALRIQLAKKAGAV